MMLDRERGGEFKRGKSRKRAYRSGVRTTEVREELLFEVIKGVKGIGLVKVTLIFAMTAFNLTVSRGI